MAIFPIFIVTKYEIFVRAHYEMRLFKNEKLENEWKSYQEIIISFGLLLEFYWPVYEVSLVYSLMFCTT